MTQIFWLNRSRAKWQCRAAAALACLCFIMVSSAGNRDRLARTLGVLHFPGSGVGWT